MRTLEDMEFPVYRKYANGQRYYKIMSATHFEEIQKIGTRYIKHMHEAQIYPDKLYVQELIHLNLTGVLASSREEYEGFIK